MIGGKGTVRVCKWEGVEITAGCTGWAMVSRLSWEAQLIVIAQQLSVLYLCMYCYCKQSMYDFDEIEGENVLIHA